MENSIDVSKLSMAEADKLLRDLQTKKKADRAAVREAYEGLKAGFMEEVLDRVCIQAHNVFKFHSYLTNEVEGFRQIMAEYGAINSKQMGFRLVHENFKLEVKTNKVKKFDERADMAAQRLIVFLKEWIKGQQEGADNPMYQLAMMSIERNRQGDLDYKQVSNLYKLETGFADPEYTAIMELFRESHTVEGTATHYYFWRKDENEVWRKIEVSFNQL